MLDDTFKKGIALFAAEISDAAVNQEKQDAMRDFAHDRGIDIVGFLAIEKAHLTSGIEHAISMCLDKRASHIIIDELARLTLPPRNLINVLTLLVAKKIDLASAKDGTVLTSSTLATLHQLLTLSMSADAQIRSQKIKNALLKKKRKGLKLGSRKFGAVPSESYVIRQMMKLREQGHSLQTICQLLENNQIHSAQKKKWHPTTVKRILDRALSHSREKSG
ncbi:MAG TPA: recombinase family protein [Myxococcota bacterium]|nr:recombinase family protein [Myxococcota bacterium]